MGWSFFKPFRFAESRDVHLVSIRKALCLCLQKGIVLLQIWLVEACFSAVNQARKSGGSRIWNFGVGMKHFDDAIDQHQDGVA